MPRTGEPMTRGMRTTTLREIRASLGRYLAIAAIIALGVGFFAGLRNTTVDMIATTDKYLDELHLFDYRLVSTIGFTDNELEMLRKDPLVSAADGEISCDVIGRIGAESDECVLAFHSVTKGVNELSLRDGRMPGSPDECVVDARSSAWDRIGSSIIVSGEDDRFPSRGTKMGGGG